MKKKLPELSREMAQNDYREIQVFQVDNKYHLFDLAGNESKPGFYKIRQTASGVKAEYGDCVRKDTYFWDENLGGPLSPEDAEEAERQEDEAVANFENMLEEEHEKFWMEMELCWNEGKESKFHQDSEMILTGDNGQKKNAEELKSEIKKISRLDPLEQEFERNRLSKEFGIRKSLIDHSIRQLAESKQKKKRIVEELEPAADPVDGEKLLDEILADLKRRVILPVGAGVAVTLWILLTYCFEAFNALPLLGITSPTKRCGKTTLIEILRGLVSKELSASNISSAAVFRTVEKCSPTLLIDEADTFLKKNDELRGIINSGHTRGSAFVIRVVGDNHEPVKFSTWGPKAIGMIGTLPDTIKDRAIVIKLARKFPGEKIVKTGLDFKDSSKGIRRKLLRWANDHLTKLKSISVPVPGSGNDRTDDNWLPLFTIAHVIGGTWPEKVAKSMQQLVSVSGDDAVGTKLLSDIQGIFVEYSVERMFSINLVYHLKELSDNPWADWNKGKGITPNGLARLLKPFGVTSKTMRIDGDLAKGYTLESLQDAFNRYIPCDPNVTPLQTNDFSKLDEIKNVTQGVDVTDENFDNQLNLFDCYDVTDGIDDIGGKKKIMQCFECPAHDKTKMVCHAASYYEGKSGAGLPSKIAVSSCKYFQRTV